MLKVKQVNAMDRHEFTRVLAAIFEHSPWIAARTAARRPFARLDDLYASLCDTVMKAAPEEKLALIRAHPDLAGREQLTRESRAEQASAGLNGVSSKEIELFRDYNVRYRERFGFPFIICARANGKEAVLDAFAARLENSREEEMETALLEIFKIADWRLRELVE